MNAPIACPVCGQNDQIQKISAIRSSGTATGSFSGPTGGVTYSNKQRGSFGGYSYMSGSTVTALAKMLEPPRSPSRGEAGCIANFGISMLFVLAGAIIAESMPVIAVPITQSEGREPEVATIGILMLAVGAFLWWLAVRTNRREKAKKQKVFDEAYTHEKIAWDKVIAKYDRCYYCFRDDQVFDPETSDHCTPRELATFLTTGLP
jgi:hypothetical protein